MAVSVILLITCIVGILLSAAAIYMSTRSITSINNSPTYKLDTDNNLNSAQNWNYWVFGLLVIIGCVFVFAAVIAL